LSDNPFWFVNEKLLIAFLRDEFRLVTELFAKYPQLREFFDLPEATFEQTAACFALLVHRALIEEIDEKFLGLYQEPPSSNQEEKQVMASMQNLFADDAPASVLEVNQMAEIFPSRVFEALPEPLLRGGFYGRDEAENEIIRSAADKLSSVEKIQLLVGKVFHQQLERLEGRWKVVRPIVSSDQKTIEARRAGPSKKKVRRTRDKLRIARDRNIAEIDEISPTITEYLKLMDERNIQPQPTWSGWPNSWREAYKIPYLRELNRCLARYSLRGEPCLPEAG